MNIGTVISTVLAIYPKVQEVMNTGVSFNSLAGLVTDPSVISVFEGLGAQAFPQLKSELHLVAGIATSYNSDNTKWLQNCLNQFVNPSPNLTVDGSYGPKTKAAVIDLQKQIGNLIVDGYAGDKTQAAILALLKK